MNTQPFADAQWIWPTGPDFIANQHVQFRKDFSLAAVPRQAPFFITADQYYALYVNGQYVSRGPARGFQKSWPYDQVDLAPWLKKGGNWISVHAYNAGVSTFQYLHERAAGLLCRGQWASVEIKSDATWLTRVAPGHQPRTGRLSMQLHFQESVDARRDDQRWIFHPRKVGAAAGWSKPGVCRALGSMPWHALEPRGIPDLTGTVRPYAKINSIALGPCTPGYQTAENITYAFWPEYQQLTWQPHAPGKPKGRTLPLEIPPSGPGRLTALCVDMGEPTIGALIVDVTGAAGGEVLDFFFTESAAHGVPHLNAPGWDCHAAMSARVILAPGKTRHEFFNTLGHRHVVVIARENPAALQVKLSLRETIYPLDVQGQFHSNDPVFNDIHKISARTQRVCMLDSYVDTPWREQAQWWGDARVQVQNTFHLSADPRLLVRGIRSLARQEVPNGLTYGHAPTCAHGCILPDFSLIWALTIWDHYYQTGDTTLFAEQWPRIERLLAYFQGEGRGIHGLLTYDPRYWLFLDWTDIHKDGVPTLLNLWYLCTLEKLSVLAGAARMTQARTKLRALATTQQQLVMKHLFDRTTGLFRDGLKTDGSPVNVHSVHTQTLAILCGLAPASHGQMLDQVLLPYLNDQTVPGAQPSTYWVTYVYDVMESAGYGRQVAEHIRRHWQPMIPWGGTAENWGPDGRGSTNTHAWAAHPVFHLARTLAGVRQTAPAWRTVDFAPVLDVPGVNHASVTIPVPPGKSPGVPVIQASWQRAADGSIDAMLRLPKGIGAQVRLGPIQQVVTGAKRWHIRAAP